MAASAQERGGNGALRLVAIAWLLTSVYYFYQYVLRSAPAVMVPELTQAFGLSAVGLASLVGLFYFGYAPFSLVAGVAMDQLGPRRVVPVGAALLGVGALLFASGDPTIASAGRFLQGAAGVFALIGAVYIATTHFPASRAATLIGATQIAGLMFLPTTIFDMVWGVRFLQEAHDLPYSMAVMRSATVPFGWIIGCPLLGMLSDRIGRRKPVIAGSAALLLGCFLMILYGPAHLFPPFVLGLLTGIASGGAMIPYTVIKEANRPEHSGTATGVINFINFSLSALLGPVFANLLVRVSAGGQRDLTHYQAAFEPLAYGVALAILLTFLLRETGTARD